MEPFLDPGPRDPLEQPLPGLVLLERVRGRGAGDLWHARSAAGEPLLVRRLRLPAGEQLRAHVALAAQSLLDLRDRHLVSVREVVTSPEGIALVVDPGEVSTSLLDLVSVRGRLDPGEVVTLGTALAQALAELHSAGVPHGRISAADVLLTRDGTPRLAGAGVAGLLGSAGRPSEDVRDLAELLLVALGHEAGAVATALADVAAALEPEAEQLGRALLAGGEAQPIRLTAEQLPERPQPLPVPRPGPRRRLRRPALAVPAVLVVLTCAGLVGWRSAPTPPAPVTAQAPASPAAAGGSASPAAPAWPQVLAQLDAERAEVFAHPDESALARVDATGSSASAYDLGVVRALRARKASVRGLRTLVDRLSVRESGSDRTVVDVVDRLTAHSIVDATGTVLESRPATPASRSTLILVRTDDGWRFAQATR